MMRLHLSVLLLTVPLSPALADPTPPASPPSPAASPTVVPIDPARAATMFGARPSIQGIALSPDGRRVLYLEPDSTRGMSLIVANADGTGNPIRTTATSGDTANLDWCDWASDERIVCSLYGSVELPVLASFVRLLAIDADGSNLKQLGQNSMRARYSRQFDGGIIGWPASKPGSVLMAREYVPEVDIRTRLVSDREGLGVDLLDTATLRAQRLEEPRPDASDYIADADGTVRIMRTADVGPTGMLMGVSRYFYRRQGSRQWEPFSIDRVDQHGLVPIAIDLARDAAYATRSNEGRVALYRVSLKGDLATELVYAHPQVDVDDIIRFGRSNTVIGASVVTDRRQTIYFDPVYQRIANSLARTLPGLPLIRFISASRDGRKVIVFAGSDVDPGRYYVLDWPSKTMMEFSPARLALRSAALAPVRAVSYRAADGTMIPAYLTMPLGNAQRNLPAIVMPHGGPASRDEWGFDWLAQYYASKGYAVLQPNFRGSAGYGDDWYVQNGFRSWRTAVGDVTDGGRWLLSEGIADPRKLAIVGWSYGGYAALQANVLDPDLFKAAVAIAPVADLGSFKLQAQRYTSGNLVGDYVGTGPHIEEGSPARNAGRFKAPVLMFSGDRDLNVDVAQARAMDRALRAAGKRSELIIYEKLDHQIDDSQSRTDMLSRSDAFLRAAMGM